MTNKYMVEPVCLSSGIVVEKAAVFAKIDDGPEIFYLTHCPKTNQPLKKKVFPVPAIKKQITDWRLKDFDEGIQLAEKYQQDPIMGDILQEIVTKQLDILDPTVYIHRKNRLNKLVLSRFKGRLRVKKVKKV